MASLERFGRWQSPCGSPEYDDRKHCSRCKQGKKTFRALCDGRFRRRAGNVERKELHRLRDVLEPVFAEIAHSEIESGSNLSIGVLGKTYGARIGHALKASRNIDPVAHEVAVALFDDVAEVNAHPEFDAAVWRKPGVTLDHAALEFDRAAHGFDHAAKLDKNAVAGSLDDPPLMDAMVGSRRSLRNALNLASVRSSSTLASLLKPTTSAANIAASFLPLVKSRPCRS